MNRNLCFSCNQELKKHTKDELLVCVVNIVKGVSEN